MQTLADLTEQAEDLLSIYIADIYTNASNVVDFFFRRNRFQIG
ncbi:hypothetical protein THIAE_02765 [Thiomicrospira aerophila AL3]|uniref:Uncharacterized protein n=1 Tax=Thiomicrospira aerophila AL3 TaxID=717772 RepID=W0DUV2_9GAMM|nr:hypothetical protein [Thiomicrospira aerophila]AHF02202.1 hypothetical protein THIAE_02765 [Thiomicrospira aerophila AL3]